jgi:hypothetical protein
MFLRYRRIANPLATNGYSKLRGTFKDKLSTTRQDSWLKVMQQKHGIFFNDMSSPMVKFTSIRMLLAIATIKDLEIYQVDFKNAYLNGDLNETIFMKQLDRQVFKGEEEFVCKLQKSIWANVKFKKSVLKTR